MWIMRIQDWQALKSFEWSENGEESIDFWIVVSFEIWKNSKINVQKIPPIPNWSRDEIRLINTLIKYWRRKDCCMFGVAKFNFTLLYVASMNSWIWILFTIWLCVLNVAMISGRLELQLLEVHFTPAPKIDSVGESSVSLHHVSAQQMWCFTSILQTSWQ